MSTALRPLAATLLATGLLALAPAATAADFAIRIGGHSVNPKSDNGTLAGLPARVGNQTALTGGISWHLDRHWFTDLWLGLGKFEHEVRLDGAGTVATVEHRPIALGINYRAGIGAFRPFVGLGYGWVRVSGERAFGILTGSRVEAGNASGITYVVGADIHLGQAWFLRADARRLDFDTRVRVDGADVGTANVDPWVYGLSVGVRF
ncbi:MAG: OmpW/AlkL family protein [Rehaibacterium terrae]|uniref:OmpW/AlkL family protein n=1 Tax=Rehaibacterium terrae TaxID=1341696 RepID=UPI00391C726A